MRNHGLFQAICRVNRLDGEDKDYGYIIDYKDLFNSLEGAVADYTGDALDGYDKEDVAGLLENRLEKARGDLEETRETVRALCEPVSLPRETSNYIHYFCAEDTAEKDAVMKSNEPRRAALYAAVASFVRAYANLANEMPDAGYTPEQAEDIRKEAVHYDRVRQEVRIASADYPDMKRLEPAMRYLLDNYIRAGESEKVSAFDELGLVDLLVKEGKGALERLPEGIREDAQAMSETIENNIRKVIIDEQPANPKYYEKMSELLEVLIQQRKEDALEYKEYLDKLVDLASKVQASSQSDQYPVSLSTPAKRALYDNLGCDEAAANRVDTAVRYTREDDWRGNKLKEKKIRNAVCEELGKYETRADEIFEIVKAQREY